MFFMDTQAIINVEKVKMLDRPVTQMNELEEEINTAIKDGWELAEIKIVPEDRHAYALLVEIRIMGYGS